MPSSGPEGEQWGLQARRRPCFPGGLTQTPLSPRPPLFCRDLPQSAAAEAAERPQQHGVPRQREPGGPGRGAGGEAPVLRGPLSWPGTPGSPRGPPQPGDTPLA